MTTIRSMLHWLAAPAVLLTLGVACTTGGDAPRRAAHRAHCDSIVSSLTDVEALHAAADSFALTDDAVGEMVAQQRLGRQLRNTGQFDSALAAHARALELACQLADTTEMVRALNNQGTDFRRLGNIEEAITYHYQALKLCDRYSDHDSYAAQKNRVTALNGIGNICLSLGNLATADSAFRIALDGEARLGSDLGQAINCANLGAIMEERGLADSAWVYYNRSMALNRRAGSELGVALCHNHFGHLHEAAGQLDSAGVHYRQAYDLLEACHDTWHWLDVCQALARLSVENGNTAQARHYISRADSAANAIRSLEHQAGVLRLNYLLARRTGDPATALECYLACDRIEDSIAGERNSAHLLNTRINYERERSQAALDRLGDRYRSERLLRHLLAAVVALLLALAVLTYLLSRTRTRNHLLANQLLTDQLLALNERQDQEHRRAAQAEAGEIADARRSARAESDREFLDRVTSAVYDAIDRHQLDVEQIASQLCVTASQLRRRVRAITGLTPHAYATSLRMARARTMLAERHDLTVGEIAEQCGFNDLSHFSRLFKQTYQLTPTQLRDGRIMPDAEGKCGVDDC